MQVAQHGPSLSPLQPEAEWIATAVHQLFGFLCSPRPGAPLPRLASIRPLIVVNRDPAHDIPKHWKTEQILDAAANDFSPLPGIRDPSDGGIVLNEDDAAFVLPIPSRQYRDLAEGFEKQSPRAPATVVPAKVPSASGAAAATNGGSPSRTPMEGGPSAAAAATAASPVQRRSPAATPGTRSKGEMGLPPPPPEEFGQAWSEATMQRLQLPASAPAQVQRLHDLAASCPKHGSITPVQKLEAEKAMVKSELKGYDQLFLKTYNRWPTRLDKEPLRGLYTYYRRIKLSIERISKRNVSTTQDDTTGMVAGGQRNVPVVSGQSQSSTTYSTDMNGGVVGGGDLPSSSVPGATDGLFDDTLRLTRLQEEKLRIRNKLQDFQQAFFAREGRPIKYHRDIVSVEHEYKQYKIIREHINRLTERIRRRAELQQLSASGHATEEPK